MLGLILAVGILGCPHAFRKDGSIDQALQDDVEELIDPAPCPPREELEKHCAGQPDPAQCIARCSRK
jgi:hypothetical protein